MDKQFEGVRPASESSIEIDFEYAGQPCRERIRLKPTPSNLKKAANQRIAILKAIDQGTFNYLEYFPNSKQAQILSAPIAECAIEPAVEPVVQSRSNDQAHSNTK